MQALIIGADSFIGGALYHRLAASGYTVHATSRRPGSTLPLDLAEAPSMWPVLPECDVAFFCAAITKLDTCKNDPAGTRLINVERMRELAMRLQRQGTFIIFLSSNQVFDGSKPFRRADEPVSPLNEYGKQKAELEQWLMQSGYPAAVLRLTKVISARLLLLDKWQSALSKNETVEAFGDLIFAPLPLQAALEGLEHIGMQKKPGIFQLSGRNDVSYFGIAQELAKRIGADASLVKQTSALAAGIAPEALPKCGTLEHSFPHILVPEPFEVIFTP